MANEHVSVVARITAKPGREEEVQKELEKLVEETQHEKGVIEYELHQAAESASMFLIYEIWESQADLDAHLNSPHVRAFLDKTDELLKKPVDIVRCTKLAGCKREKA